MDKFAFGLIIGVITTFITMDILIRNSLQQGYVKTWDDRIYFVITKEQSPETYELMCKSLKLSEE